MSFAYQSAFELTRMIVEREISPLELTEDVLRRQVALEPAINAFVTRTPEIALAAAKQAEKAVMAGDQLGLLHGLPLSVKDLISMQGVPWTSGSRPFAKNIGAVDAPAVARARAAGACIIGKSTTSEFGCKGSGDSPLTGITRNPWNLDKTPGGSSAGAGASVAAGLTPFALGTDGGGSIRIPSSLCGLFGIKAQFSRVPLFPIPATPTLSHVGPLARSVRDAALLLTAISGHDARDPFAVAAPVPDYLGACEHSVEGMKIAWSPTFGYARSDAEILEISEKAARAFEQLGCRVEEVAAPFGDEPLDIWMAEFFGGVGTKLKDLLADSPEQLDPAVVEMLSGALDQTIDEYFTKVFARYAFRETVREFFDGYDLLLSPVLPVAAFDTGLNVPPGWEDRNPVSWVYYTYPFNVTGQPAASIPAGFTKAGLPVGLQMVARINSETDIFRAAAAFEEAFPWADKKPQLATSGADN
ncbi:MAG: amidase family protein [Alphaproteobacteria bacterium]|jgi:Asp-tRNA(Asn)/Glu-tRNA(Gln) amidotransferase A subunit family amidase|nr:amidase family protein [Alphaproteobacteria bacterium]MDP6816721.1 amidase family protein [Alphaproteobacteria bacterium]